MGTLALLLLAAAYRRIDMPRKKLLAGLLAMSFATLVSAQTAAGGAAAAASAVDPGAIRALKDMGAYLQTLKRFHVATSLTGERVLADGQKLQHQATAELDVERPNRLRAVMSSARSERQLTYDGQTVTLYTPEQGYYSAVPFTGTLGELAERLEQRYAVELPLSDLFVWGTPAAPLDSVESAMNAGQDFIGKDLCDHYAFRQGNVDWQVWVLADGKPLPRKLVITNRGDEARPQSVSVLTWNLQPAFSDTVFRFVPPKGSTSVEIVPRKTK
jgi:hypothetical protein